MMLSKKNPRKMDKYLASTTCTILVLLVLLLVVGTGRAVSEPKTIAEIALYQGPDREKILIEGAKKEGEIAFYNINTIINNVVAREFEKKYPFVKVLGWRSDPQKLVKRVTEEYAAGRFLVDVIEVDAPAHLVIHREGLLQEYYTPELTYYGDEAKLTGKTGLYFLAHRVDFLGLGFNTKLISPAEAPKTLKDLLDPRWKGKMSINPFSGVYWIGGNVLEVMDRSFMDKLRDQGMKVQNISGAALANLIVVGEVPLSPAVWMGNIMGAKKKGAPVEWRPLDQVVANVGYSGLATKASHPYAALLFLDYIHSKEGQMVVIQSDLHSSRKDMQSSEEREFKKFYIEAKYKLLEEYEKKFNEWGNLITQVFIKKQ